jgi:hypothetical protein
MNRLKCYKQLHMEDRDVSVSHLNKIFVIRPELYNPASLSHILYMTCHWPTDILILGMQSNYTHSFSTASLSTM